MTVTFDGPLKIITCETGTTVLEVPDLYSRWKDWVLAGNAFYPEAMKAVGGDVIDAGAGTSIPAYVFLANGWRIRPQEADHTLSVKDGVLLVEGGGDPFINTVGVYRVAIRYSQPAQAITVSTGGGGDPSAIADAVWEDVRSLPAVAGSGLDILEKTRKSAALSAALAAGG